MNRVFYVAISLFGMFSPAYAAEVADSAEKKVDLQEVVVEAQNVKIKKNVLTAIPNKLEKSNSDNGFSLVEKMMIPNIVIDRENESIKMIDGTEVAYAINGLPSSLQEVKGIRPDLVKRIEVIEHPMDVNLYGYAAVINYVVKDPTMGGYVNFGAVQTFITNRGLYSIFSKYTKRKWTFQLGAQYEYQFNGDRAVWNESKYNFGNGNEINLNHYSFEKNHLTKRLNGAVKAVYRPNNSSVLTLSSGVWFNENPSSLTTGYFEENELRRDYAQRTGDRLISPYVTASYTLKTQKSYFINIEGRLSGSFNRQNSLYTADEVDIINNNKENNLNAQLKFSLNKSLSKRDDISFLANGTYGKYNTYYSQYGNEKQVKHQQKYSGQFTWSHSFPHSFTMNLSALGSGEIINMADNERMTSLQPKVSVYLMKSFGDNKRLTLNGDFSGSHRLVSLIDKSYLVDNEFEGNAGNPDLKTSKYLNLSTSYVQSFNNKYSITVSGSWNRMYDPMINTYLEKDGIIYNRFGNGGTNDAFFLNLMGTIRLLGGKLGFQPNVNVERRISRGIYNFSYWDPSAELYVLYMLTKKWYFSVNCSTPKSLLYYNGAGGYEKRNRAIMDLTCGYNAKGVNATLSINPLYHRVASDTYANGDLYNLYTHEVRKLGARYIQLQVSYTFRYGHAKVQLEQLNIENNSSSAVR